MKVGVLGGGQLARMLALAGHPLGMEFAFLDPAPDACAFPLGRALHGAYDDPRKLDELADFADVVTFEFENVPAAVTERLAAHVPVYPAASSLAVAQDRLLEKKLFRELDIGTPAFHAVDNEPMLAAAAEELSYPFVLKTRSDGYDGKGQQVVRNDADRAAAWQILGGRPLIAEAFVRFQREVSVVAVRSRDGEVHTYPLAENRHDDGILTVSRSLPENPVEGEAHDAAHKLLDRLDYVGVLALELFDCDGELLANEFAPRVHNSGHWTIEGAATSQFENHLRAVCGLPLGSTQARGRVAMLNLIGELPAPEPLLALRDVHLHIYGKAARPGRKIGHLTVWADDESKLAARFAEACAHAGA
jgi:5-(carboxyamino)imidazole ribonucleotide synthase